MIHDIECPYCGHPQNICHDDGYGYEEDELHQHHCGACDKVYGFYTSIIYHYEAQQVPCFNGVPHKWEPNTVLHRQGFPDARKCDVCGAREQGRYKPREQP